MQNNVINLTKRSTNLDLAYRKLRKLIILFHDFYKVYVTQPLKIFFLLYIIFVYSILVTYIEVLLIRIILESIYFID